MLFANPFTRPGHWFKGSLHVHSTASDGALTPDEVVDWYQSRGYHFLALADHDVLSEAQSPANDFITLSGIEVKGIDQQAGLFHLVGLGLRRQPKPVEKAGVSMQEAINRLQAAGGLVWVAHPYWSGQMSKDLLEIEGCMGIEVYNGSCEVENGRGFSTVHWDDLLTAGRRLLGLAVDDAHWQNGSKDAGLGWVWVKAAALTQEAILDALEQGNFYASSGPEIHDLQLNAEQGDISISCSPSVLADFIGDGPHSCRVSAPPGGTLTEASYRLQDHQRYVRVACQDTHGRWAWSNPIICLARAPHSLVYAP